MSREQANTVPRSQLAKIILVPILMFGFGFALIPLYDVFCDITGQNGKTGRIEASAIDESGVDTSRTIEVRFLAQTNTGLPWSFEPVVKTMQVHPGQVYEAHYRVRSSSKDKTHGQAVPSVSPGLAAQHFNKTECFCFTRQELNAFETRDMPLRFIVGKDIAEEIKEITLSYTFFSLDQG
ncbi:MAG: cytochrome c oxidase assembly protein [Gammaproteobacteria bacterium]|nr:MAG: cytochrome c oxidase assembly protein [Gammaproteobacteria bacterium]UCH39837.1 MAG: cytochrome c oxidase assembly protein [Gammaproteobacteria bacterium]